MNEDEEKRINMLRTRVVILEAAMKDLKVMVKLSLSVFVALGFFIIIAAFYLLGLVS